MTRPDEIESPEELRALPKEALPAVCARLREEIIDVCGRVGGHLGASLGAVEVIVALHRVFHAPHDRLVFDVGHQAYAHKLLTGRRARIGTLRQEDGIAPFLDPTESPHDVFAGGHACTALSVALGLAQAKQLKGEKGRCVAVIGDGGLTGGLTFEALNNAGAGSVPVVLVLNDNQMSISENVGAVSHLLQGREARALFESLGFSYLGPIDGHDLDALETAFREAKSARKPVVVHARTLKGKGFAPAEADARTRGHAMGPYELRDGKLVRSRGAQVTFSEAFARELELRMERDPRVVCVTPAMLEGSALVGLHARFPDRVFDVGIAEQHAVTFSAGLAAQGLKPVCAIYSTFLQRAYDQVIHDVCLPGLPVVFAIDRAGLVGADGATHQGAYDLSFLRPLPGMAIAAPAGGEELGPMLDAAFALGGPVAIRFPRATVGEPHGWPDVTGTRARWLQRPTSPTHALIALGPLALAALEAARGQPCWAVLDARFLSPLDAEAVLEAARCGRVVTVEEGTTHGGLGSAVLELLAAHDVRARVRCLGLPDRFVRHGDARAQRKALGLDADGIAKVAHELSQSEP